MCGSENLQKAGVFSPLDLLKFPWENEIHDQPNEDEIGYMKGLIAAENERLQAEQANTE